MPGPWDWELDEDAFAARLVQKVAARLKDPPGERFQRADPLVAGIFRDPPPPGTVESACASCQEPILVGPESQRVLAERPTAVALCIACLLVVTNTHGGEGVEVDVRRAKDER
jgi:hypothetical protein